MRLHARYLLAAISAAVALGALVGSASANNLSLSNQRFRTTWSALEFIASSTSTTVRCAVTLEGSFHSATIRKVERALIGHVTAAMVRRPCTGGTAWAHNGREVNEVLGNTVLPQTLPWHVTWEGFTGTLPNISSVRILLSEAAFTIRAGLFGINTLCVYRTGASGNATGTIALAAGVAQSISAGGEISSSSGGFCPRGSFAGVGRVMLQGNTTSITVRLI